MNSQANKPSYAQASKSNIKNIVKIKNVFLKLSVNKVSEIHKAINNTSQKDKLRLNMTTKDSSRKYIIIPIRSNNAEKIMVKANTYSSNINRLLKRVKSKISVDFIWSDKKELLITTNKVAAISDLNIIEKYLKNLNNVNSNNIISSRLLQSKSYLKILDILYFVEDPNLLIPSDIIESITKSTHNFNDIILIS